MLIDKIKSLVSDTLAYGVFQTLGRLFTFLLTPLYSNYLSTTDNGIMAYLFSILVFFQFIYVFGMEAAFFRFYKKNDDAHNKKVFTTAYCTIAILSIIFTLFFIIFSNSISSVVVGTDTPNSLYIFQVVCLIPLFDGLIVIPYGHLRMQRKIKRFAITRFLLILLSVLLNAYFVIFTNLGVLGVFIGQLISCIVGLCLFLPQIAKMMDFHIDWALFKDMLKFGLPTIPSNISAIVLQVADRPIMKLFVNNDNIGIYQINAKLAVPMLMVVTVFDYAWKPFFLSHYESDDSKPLFSRVLTYYILVASLVWIFISLFIDYIVRIPLWNGRYFIHPNYWDGMGVVTLILLGYLFNGITVNFAAVFHIEKKTKYLPIAVGISAIISLGLNFILIPMLGASGAAVSLVIGYASGAFLMKYLQNKVNYKIQYEWHRIIILAISALIVVLAGKYATINLDLTMAFFVKLALILMYIALLRAFKFFTKGEIVQLKRIFSKK